MFTRFSMKKYLLSIAGFLSIFMLHAQIVVNEICPANADINYDLKYFNYSPWVELYNAGNSSVNIGGYFLSDDVNVKDKWKIPANNIIPAQGYLIIWCDDNNSGLHSNFSLDSDGEEVVLSNTSLLLLDRVEFDKQYTNVSYGRIGDGKPGWGYLAGPTPAAPNTTQTLTDQLANPDFSIKAGRYTGTQTLSISHPTVNVVIRYTQDGSEPTTTSPIYTSPLAIPTTRTIKAKAFMEGRLPSKTEVKTFFINEHPFTLPVVSISTKPAYLWDNLIGIYTDGTNGTLGNCQNAPVNWNQDWYRHADFEYFEPDGEKKFDQGVDIRIGGGCSRGNPQKSLILKARDKYGKNVIEESLFDSKQVSSYGGFIYRNGGNDFYGTSFRDALMQTLTIGQMDVDYLAYKPTIFYFNGEYWGIQNMREKIDADYIESNYGIKKDDIDLIETWGAALEGTTDVYNAYLSTLQQMDLTDPASFEYIDQHIDVQEFINYLVTEIYCDNTDWPGNNVKFWRQRSTNGKFRWILWDLDFGFALYTNQSYITHPMLNFATDPASGVDWPNPPWATLHLRLLLQNPVFRNRFIQTFTAALGTTFKPERVVQFIDDFQNKVKDEMPYHKQRWGGDMGGWNYEVQRLRDFAASRNEFMQQHLSDFFGLGGEKVTINLTSTPPDAGRFNFNHIITDGAVVNAPYYEGIPVVISPEPRPGYVFKDWKITRRESNTLSMITKGDSWKYYDLGSSPGSSWMQGSFDDSAWPAGQAELGYGDGDESTVVSYGGDSNNKYITTYFRKKFSLADVTGIENLRASILFDDGVVVYLNGVEVYRNNMPAGTVDFNTQAPQAIPTEGVFSSFTIDPGLLNAGDNILAVEIHQTSGQSSDISFDVELSGVKIGNSVEYTTTDPIFTDTVYTDVLIEASFELADPLTGIVVNEFCPAKAGVTDESGDEEDWIELYNSGSQPVDIAGLYVTDNLSDKTKFRIPSGHNETVIQPQGYKLLWADEELEQGPLHLNFKLDADGEAIGLYQFVGNNLNVIDELEYDDIPVNVSSARIPNGTGSFTLTSRLTPGSANIFEIVTATGQEFSGEPVVFPNPVTERLIVKAVKNISSISVSAIIGTQLKSFSPNSTEVEVPFDTVSPGVYILRIQCGKDLYVAKVVKK